MNPNPAELLLFNLRYREGRLVDVSNNKPLLLDDPHAVWVVYAGIVDLFSIRTEADGQAGANRHHFRCRAGDVLFGIAPNAGLGLRVAGTPGTTLLRLGRDQFSQLSNDEAYKPLIQGMIERWVAQLAHAVSDSATPQESTLIQPNEDRLVGDDITIFPRRGIAWVQSMAGRVTLLGHAHLNWHNGAGHLPVSRFAWGKTTGISDLSIIDTATYMTQYSQWYGLDQYHQMILVLIAQQRQEQEEEEKVRLYARARHEDEVMQTALAQLSSPLTTDRKRIFGTSRAARKDPMFAACQLVGNAMGIDVKPGVAPNDESYGKALKRIAAASRLQMREVQLRSDWWKQDNGPLLAFLDQGEQPVALLRDGRNYELVDTVREERQVISAEIATTLLPIGYSFYKPLPDKALSLWQLLRFGLAGSEKDVQSIFILSLLIALLGLVPPIVVGWLFDTVLPQAQMNLLLQVGIGLIILTVATTLLRFGRGMRFLRTETRLDATLQATCSTVYAVCFALFDITRQKGEINGV